MFVEYPFLRGAQLLVCAMHAAWPAAWSAHAFGELRGGSFEAARASLEEFGVFYPTNPLIAREWRDVVPDGENCFVSGEGFAQIGWKLMDCAAEDFLGGHITILHQALPLRPCDVHLL